MSGLISWDRAQAPFVNLSHKLGDLVQAELAKRFKGSPSVAQIAPVRQLRTTAAPAIAVEVSSVSVGRSSDAGADGARSSGIDCARHCSVPAIICSAQRDGLGRRRHSHDAAMVMVDRGDSAGRGDWRSAVFSGATQAGAEGGATDGKNSGAGATGTGPARADHQQRTQGEGQDVLGINDAGRNVELR